MSTKSSIHLALLLLGAAALTSQGCKKEPVAKPASAPLTAPTASKTSPAPAPSIADSAATQLKDFSMYGPFPELDKWGQWRWDRYDIPWDDTTAFSKPLSGDSAWSLLQAFQESWKAWDTIAFTQYQENSITRHFKENLDFHRCGGSENFTTLKKKRLHEALMIDSAPKPGFTYRILGKDGQFVPVPLGFEPMRVRVYQSIGETVIPNVPMWRASSADSAANRAIAALKGTALVVGQRNPVRNAPVVPVPIDDSLKWRIIRTIVPADSMLRLFSGVQFQSLGKDGGRQRVAVNFWYPQGNGGGNLFIVDVVDGECQVQLRVNSFERSSLEFAFSLSASPIGEVIVVRIYEESSALIKVDGKWIWAYFEYNDPYNRGC